MKTMDDRNWVHEDDYGSFAVGGIILGFIQLVWGLVLLVKYLITGK